MPEVVIAIVFASLAYYVSEKDNKESDLYKILHQER